MAGDEFLDRGIRRDLVQIDGIGMIDYVKKIGASFWTAKSLLQPSGKEQILVDVSPPLFHRSGRGEGKKIGLGKDFLASDFFGGKPCRQ